MEKFPLNLVHNGVWLESRRNGNNWETRREYRKYARTSLWRVHTCLASHPTENRGFGGLLSRFSLSHYDYGSRRWFFSLKLMEWWGRAQTFPSKDSFPLKCVRFFIWGLAHENQHIPANHHGLHKWTDFLDILMFQIGFALLPQKFWGFLMSSLPWSCYFSHFLFGRHPNLTVTKKRLQCLDITPSAKWLTDEKCYCSSGSIIRLTFDPELLTITGTVWRTECA